MADRATLTGMVISLNEAPRIAACLKSLAFCDEILLIDSGSTDGTPDIAKGLGARVIERPFLSMNDQKDFGRRESKSAWVLNLDADEVLSPALGQEIQALFARGIPESIGAYRFPFRNYLRDQWIKSCGFYPDPHVRLMRRDRARYGDAPVHDQLLVEGEIAALSGHVDHYSFDSIRDYLGKSNDYAERFAQEAFRRGQRATAWDIFVHSAARFFRSYFLRGGIFDGALGLTMAGLQTAGTFQKYARLWELNRFG
ncbi:MAG: glycosyltransferase family 2 protein [Myxococcota bacterium]